MCIESNLLSNVLITQKISYKLKKKLSIVDINKINVEYFRAYKCWF